MKVAGIYTTFHMDLFSPLGNGVNYQLRTSQPDVPTTHQPFPAMVGHLPVTI